MSDQRDQALILAARGQCAPYAVRAGFKEKSRTCQAQRAKSHFGLSSCWPMLTLPDMQDRRAINPDPVTFADVFLKSFTASGGAEGRGICIGTRS